jgi:hypothetical protein
MKKAEPFSKREINMYAKSMARNLVKYELMRQGIKVSWVESSEITKAANHLLKEQPDIYDKAKRVLQARARGNLRRHK